MEILTLESDTMGFSVLAEMLSSDYLVNAYEFDFFIVIDTIRLTGLMKNEIRVICQITHFGVCSVTDWGCARKIESNSNVVFFRYFLMFHHFLGSMTHIAAVALKQMKDDQEFSKRQRRNKGTKIDN